jgi:hypothetical protein
MQSEAGKSRRNPNQENIKPEKPVNSSIDKLCAWSAGGAAGVDGNREIR